MMTFTRTMTATAVLVLLVLCTTVRVESAEALVMPRDLVDFAQTAGCSPVNDFFERPGAVDPPYVYGLLPGDKEDSVAFWCKKRAPSDKPYLLLIKATNAEQLMGCATKIEWWNYPRGLSLETRTNLSLHDFHYVTEPKRSGPVSTISNAKLIVSEYDGVSESFVCYKGEWLFLLLD